MPGRNWFWNAIARRYARMPVPENASYDRKLEATRARLTPESRVLEFGCGTGTTATRHAPHAGHVDAVDFAPEMIAIARRRAAEAGVGNIAFHEATVEGFDAPAESYDMVMMHSLLHLLDDPRAAVDKAASLLKPGGWIVTSTMALGEDGLPLMRLLLLPASALGLLPRFTPFTGDELRAMIRGAGFEVVEDWKPAPRRARFIVARKL